MTNSDYMNKAVSLAEECLNDNKRSPFGSIIVKDNEIIGIGKESIRINNDPTAHSEIEAIRDACQNIGAFNLIGCIMYTSSEPCSMCLSALFWSQIETIYYGCSREDVFQFGLPDRFKLVEKRQDNAEFNLLKLEMHQIKNDRANQVFKDWRLKQNSNKNKSNS